MGANKVHWIWFEFWGIALLAINAVIIDNKENVPHLVTFNLSLSYLNIVTSLSWQDASLQGHPESPKSVVLITGTAEYNMVSLDSTLKACLWEMGSPFLPCKTRHGVLVAKAHSLRMWLKDSPFCLDLELKDAPSIPELNSVRLIEGCFIRRGLVPAFKDITERLEIVSPKKLSRLALLPDDKRDKAIHAYTEGRKEKLEKAKKIVDPKRLKKIKKLRKRKYIREALMPNLIGIQKTFIPTGQKQTL